VGSNDGEKVGIDLTPPGFSVEELGLDEFTIAGIDGDVTPRDQLTGRASDIHLDDTATSVAFLSMAGSNHDLKRMPSGDGTYGTYVSASGGGKPVFYDASYSATHDTASDTSQVNVSGNYKIYNQPTNVSSSYVNPGNIQIADSSGNSFSDGAQRKLVQDGGSYLIQETDNSGVIRYYEAEMRFTSDESGASLSQLEARQTGAALPSLNPEPGAITSGDVGVAVPGGQVLEDADDLKFVDSDDNALSGGKLVDIGGDYYLRAAGPGGESLYHSLDDITQTQTMAGTPPETYTTFTLKANTSQGSTNPVLDDSSAAVTSSPSFSIAGEPVTLLDDAGNAFAGATRMMERNDPGHEGEYVIEVDEGGGVYSYHAAELSVTAGANGQPSALEAKATAGQPLATFRTSEADTHNVKVVPGTSQVTIDPRNVEVNYTDSNGEVHSDVLRAGSEGDSNYYFDLPQSTSEYGSFKIASLVDTEDNDILIKTINGNGEVIIYHPSNLESGTNLRVNVETDANGFGNDEDVSDGAPHTVINIVEDAEEIRLKKPKNPLAALDRAISYVDSKRSHLGAIENRLESAIEAQGNTHTNLSSARSRIMDADYATEVANMTRAQILQQAGTSVLAQANQIPQSVHSLLG
jgi:flagellin-like hook-associated protein FlgL